MPQGSVLGPLLFLLFINDITNAVRFCNIRLFADDTCLFLEVNNRETAINLINHDLESLVSWSRQWIVSFSERKTKTLTISNKKHIGPHPPLMMNNAIIEQVTNFKYLGLTFSHNLKWTDHIDNVTKKTRMRLNTILPLKFKLSRSTLETVYISFIRPIYEYGIIVLAGTYDSDMNKFEKLHIDAMRLITGATARSRTSSIYDETNFLTVNERADYLSQTMIYKIQSDMAPSYLSIIMPGSVNTNNAYNLRNNKNFRIPFARLESFKRSFIPRSIKLWNNLPITVRNSSTLSSF